MADVLINSSTMTAIASAIRTKKGVSTTYKPAHMPDAISSISTGITPTGTKSITANGTYDVTSFASAEVSVPTGGDTPTGTKQISITQNGTTTEDVASYANAQITVNVPTGGGSAPRFYIGANIINDNGALLADSNGARAFAYTPQCVNNAVLYGTRTTIPVAYNFPYKAYPFAIPSGSTKVTVSCTGLCCAIMAHEDHGGSTVNMIDTGRWSAVGGETNYDLSSFIAQGATHISVGFKNSDNSSFTTNTVNEDTVSITFS